MKYNFDEERKVQLMVSDDLYKKYHNQPEPIRLMCNCGWKGNKPRNIKFKKTNPKKCCPDCGSGVYPTADIIFWRTANGYVFNATIDDLVAGIHGHRKVESCEV
ncbi:hypothetical protein [Paenibacillus odorifer]|uniref:hypothetical protein n=1 Tax=Paenibacillus odorifer TaxID=189426 RepID=UPI0009701D6C|nr:hypothetical protein [Paenibacillus odorifer]OMD66902.1 hypothetical protein BSK50_30465 [Paenibacillus odorifer]